MTNPIVLMVGTRPEGIKMLPIYFALKRLQIPIVLCSTTQHSDLLNEVYQLFGITPDYELNVMKQNQDLFHITIDVLEKTKNLYNKINPPLVLVQGDSTSSMAACLAAYYCRIPLGHVEAGLRTKDINNPFPEELNRRFIDSVASYHFAPTQQAVSNLLAEGIGKESIFCTGNTVIDALRIIQEKINNNQLVINKTIIDKVNECFANGKQIVLVTLHRRESFNGTIHRILQAIKEFAQMHQDIFFFYPVHSNPHVLEAVEQVGLAKLPNIYLCKPLPYKDIVYLLSRVNWVATDSGGIQEEATTLGKPVLILREKTERLESFVTGLATLVGTQKEKIIENMEKSAQCCVAPCTKTVMYGNGYAADTIANIIDAKRKNIDINIDYFAEKTLFTHMIAEL